MMIEKNYVQVIGRMWMPSATGATEYNLDAYAMRNLEEIADIRYKENGGCEDITREDVAEWLTTNSGDFQEVLDFCASIGHSEIEWEDFENAFVYNDCMHGNEDE